MAPWLVKLAPPHPDAEGGHAYSACVECACAHNTIPMRAHVLTRNIIYVDEAITHAACIRYCAGKNGYIIVNQTLLSGSNR